MQSHFPFLVLGVLMLLVISCSLSAFAQGDTATLNGRVTDPTGLAVVGAEVQAVNVNTNATYPTETNEVGFYNIPALLPGTYRISVLKEGFNQILKPGVEFHVADIIALNFALQVGSVSQSVTVESGAPTVELTTSSISGVVDSTTVRELPLNGRDWTQLATLQPGVTSVATLQPPLGTSAGNSRANRGFGTQLTISGARPEQNNYRVDGISVNDYLNNSPGDVLGAATGVDAIQEFSVVTSNYSAEYGRTSGGVVNAITRSGTNQFHGDAYEFLRNSALDARNYFDGANIPPFRRNQFGGSVGGPIKKDKSFLFVDYEGLRQSLGLTALPIVPSADARNGIIHNANGTATTVTVDAKVVPFLALYALPNAGLVGVGNTGIYSFVKRQVSTDNFVTTRFDHRFSEKDSFFGTYLHDASLGTLPDSLNTLLTEQATANQRVALEESHIFSPQLINAVRFGLNRVHDVGGGGLTAINPAAASLGLSAVPGEDAPQTNVSGLTVFQGGVNNVPAAFYPWTSFQGYDDANLTVGKHTLKFGGDVERDQENVDYHSLRGGQFRFGSLTNLLLDKPKGFSVTLPPVFPRHFRQTIFGAYVQDDMHWRRNLTINLGLRYEMSRVPTETDNKLSNLPSPTATVPHLGNPFFSNPTLRNFEPRVGFAWDPFGDGKTSIRSGFGIFDVLPLWYEYHLNEVNEYPFTKSGQNSKLPQGSFPGGALALTKAVPLQTVTYTQPNPKRDYVMQWSLSVQHEVTTGLTVMAAYLGSRGVHNAFVPDDANTVLPTITSAGYLWPSPIGSGMTLNPNFGHLGYLDWTNNSFYDALEAQVIKRLSHGFQIEGSYTWSKSMDGGSGTGLEDAFSNASPNLFSFERKFNRSLADFDVRHNLVINSTWIAPRPDLGNRAMDWVLGGWEIGGIFNVRTGLPFTVLIGGDPLGTLNSSPIDFPSRLTGPGCKSAVNPGNPLVYIKLSCFGLPLATPAIAAQCQPFGIQDGQPPILGTCANLQGDTQRNSLIGPGQINLDFSLFKNNYIGQSERFNAQFRAEFFNILNHSNFDSPTTNNTVFNEDGSATGGAGLINATSTTSRQIQFALKLIW
jgi:outer membrane receptor protein involved in Fe transport